mgnify:FL=1
MKVHDLSFLEDAAPIGNHIGDGADSSVYEHDNGWVYKVTSCLKTQALLTYLMTNPARGLPLVKQSLGVCAVDEDGHTYYGFLVEKLFNSLANKDEVKRTRVGVLPLRQKYKLGTRSKTPKPGILNWLSDFWKTTQANLIKGAGEVRKISSYEITLAQLANTKELPELASAFQTLISLFGNSVYYDFARKDNVMLNSFGEVVLADPVSSQFFENHDVELNEVLLTGWKIVEQRGLKAVVEKSIIRILSQRDSEQLELKPAVASSPYFDLALEPLEALSTVSLAQQTRKEVNLFKIPDWKQKLP